MDAEVLLVWRAHRVADDSRVPDMDTLKTETAYANESNGELYYRLDTVLIQY